MCVQTLSALTHIHAARRDYRLLEVCSCLCTSIVVNSVVTVNLLHWWIFINVRANQTGRSCWFQTEDAVASRYQLSISCSVHTDVTEKCNVHSWTARIEHVYVFQVEARSPTKSSFWSASSSSRQIKTVT